VLALADDGTVLAGRHPARIDGFAPDGAVRHMLGFAGFDPDVEIEVDKPLGALESLVALPDDRVAFVTRDGDRRVLRLLDGDGVHTVAIARENDGREIHTIAPGPDGRLLAVVAGAETHPQIQVIDIETGDTDTIADLRGVMQAPDGPRGVAGALWSVAAATDGHDLVFLADGYLWRLRDAFA
jgi:hypothetical protein